MATFRKRGKSWEYRIREHNISKSGFKTKKEAQTAAIELENELKQGIHIDKSSTVYDLFEKWYHLEILPSNLSIATKEKHKRVGKQISIFLGDKIASQLKYSEYQEIINKYGEKVNKDTLSRFNGTVKRALDFARKDLIYIHDFTNGIKLNAQKDSKTPDEKFLQSVADYKKTLNFLKKKMDYDITVVPYLLYTQLKTGLRLGEIQALLWTDVDFSNKTITTYRRFDTARHIFTPPKTPTSVRTIPISDDVVDILEELKNAQDKVNIGLISDNFIFFDQRYGIISNEGINKRLKAYLIKINITPLITSTGCRHTYCSVLLTKGLDIGVLAKYMGHKDTKRIIDTYGHVLKELKDKEDTKVRKILSSI